MLMDNHGTHCTPEFIKLANEIHIRPLPLIPHLTHCMQPLDVGVFQPYKHWHDKAIQDVLAEFNTENCHGARSGRTSGGANVLLDCLARWIRRSKRRKETENPTWASIRLWRTELVPIQPLIHFPQVPSMKLSP